MTIEVFQTYEYPRTILIVYEYQETTRIIRYGATIHSDDGVNKYDRQKHLATALFRFQKYPKTIYFNLDNFGLKHREKKIRELLFYHGCR